MEEVNTFVLENGIEYMQIDELCYNNTQYLLLANYQNIQDSCIRKVTIENEVKYLCKVKNEKELETVKSLFIEKNKALF